MFGIFPPKEVRLSPGNRKFEIIISDGLGYEGPYATLTQMRYALAGVFESNAGMYGYASHF